jgi:hypothetical protein
VGTAIFLVLTIFWGDPYGIARFFFLMLVLGFVFFFLIISFAASKSRRTLLLLSALGAIVLTFVVFGLTSWQGSPAGVQGLNTNSNTNCVSVRIPNSTAPSGYVNGNVCTTTTTTTSPFFNYGSIVIDLLFWFLITSLVVYAMPVWENKASVLLYKIARNFIGSALATGLFLLVIGLPIGSGYPTLTHGLVPINPFVAFANCDSTTFPSGVCVTINAGYLALDFLYWLVLFSLAALTVNQVFVSLQRAQRKQELPKRPIGELSSTTT